MNNGQFFFQSQLLNEGGVAGHLSHIYDNHSLTFGKFKYIINQAAGGKLVGTEKTDGFNIFMTFRDGQARSARNKTDIKNGGITLGELMRRDFAGGDKVKSVFIEAFETFEKAVYGLSEEDIVQIFGPKGDIYYNIEIMGPAAENVINYDAFVLSVHRGGYGYFDRETGLLNPDIDVEANSEYLNSVLQKMQHAVSDNRFTIQRTALVNLKKITNDSFTKKIEQRIDNELRKYKLDDNSTIEDYLYASIRTTLAPSFKEYGEQFLNLAVGSILGTASLRDIPQGTPKPVRDFMSQYGRSKKSARDILKAAIWPIEDIVHDFAVELLTGLESAYILDNKSEVNRLKIEVEKAIQAIENYSGEHAEEAQDILFKQLSKIKHLDKINTVVEGFVFEFEGHLYKFTGNYAPVNQLLGLYKWGRGSVPALKPSESDAELSEGGPQMVAADIFAAPPDEPETATSGPGGNKLAYAVIPGGFKPPHAGHYAMVDEIAQLRRQNGEFLVKEVHVLISPKSREANFAGKSIEITAEDSLAIWKIYCQNNQRIIPQIATNASPVRATYEFLEQMTPNSIMVVATSQKDKDDKRFAALQDWSDKHDYGVEVKTIIVDEFGENVSGTEMRNLIASNNKKAFFDNLPHHLTTGQQQQVWNIVSKNDLEMVQIKEAEKRSVRYRDKMNFLNVHGRQKLDEISQTYADVADEFMERSSKQFGRKLSFNDLFNGRNRLIIDMPSEFKGEMKEIQDFLVKTGWELDFTTGNISREFEFEIPAGPKAGEIIQKRQEISLGKFLGKLISLGDSFNTQREDFHRILEPTFKGVATNESETRKFVEYVFKKYNLQPIVDNLVQQQVTNLKDLHSYEENPDPFDDNKAAQELSVTFFNIFVEMVQAYLKSGKYLGIRPFRFIDSNNEDDLHSSSLRSLSGLLLMDWDNWSEHAINFDSDLSYFSIHNEMRTAVRYTYSGSEKIKIPKDYPKYKDFIEFIFEEIKYRNFAQDVVEFYDSAKTSFDKLNKIYQQIGTTLGTKSNRELNESLIPIIKEPRIEEWMSFWNKESEKFRTNPEYGKENNYSVILSRHPIDVLRMSDFQNINSCHTEPGKFGMDGSYFNCAIAESQGHGLISYIVKNDMLKTFLDDEDWKDMDSDFQTGEIFVDSDRNISGMTPLSRIRVRKYVKQKQTTQDPQPVPVTSGWVQFKYPVDKLAQTFVKRAVDYGVKISDNMVLVGGKLIGASYYSSDDAILIELDEPSFLGENGLIPFTETGKNFDFEINKLENWTERGGKVHFDEKDKFKPSYELGLPELRVYGSKIPYFQETLSKWLYDNQITTILQNEGYQNEAELQEKKLNTRAFQRYGGSYADNDNGSLFSRFFGDDFYSRAEAKYGTLVMDPMEDIELEDPEVTLQQELEQWEENCQEVVNNFSNIWVSLDYEIHDAAQGDYYCSVSLGFNFSHEELAEALGKEEEELIFNLPTSNSGYGGKGDMHDIIRNTLDDYYLYGELDSDTQNSYRTITHSINLYPEFEFYQDQQSSYYTYLANDVKDLDNSWSEFLQDLAKNMVKEGLIEYVVSDDPNDPFNRFIKQMPLTKFDIEVDGIEYTFTKNIYVGDIFLVPSVNGNLKNTVIRRESQENFSEFINYIWNYFINEIEDESAKQQVKMNLQEIYDIHDDIDINFNIIANWTGGAGFDKNEEELGHIYLAIADRTNNSKIAPNDKTYIEDIKFSVKDGQLKLSNVPPKTMPLFGQLEITVDATNLKEENTDYVRDILKFIIWLDQTDFKSFRDISEKYVKLLNAVTLKEIHENWIQKFEQEIPELQKNIDKLIKNSVWIGEDWLLAGLAVYQNFKDIELSEKSIKMSKQELKNVLKFFVQQNINMKQFAKGEELDEPDTNYQVQEISAMGAGAVAGVTTNPWLQKKEYIFEGEQNV